MMTYKIFIFISFGFFLLAQGSVKNGFELTVGAISTPINSITTSETAKKEMLGELYNPFGIKYIFDISSNYQLSAHLSTTRLSLINNKDKDKGLSTYITQLGADMFFNSSSRVLFKSQLGVQMYEMKGSGGQVELRNGNDTASFDLPSRTVNSQLIYIGVGSRFDFDSFNIETDLNILSAFSSTRRTFFLSLVLGVPL